jgi:hypothetical protein
VVILGDSYVKVLLAGRSARCAVFLARFGLLTTKKN